MTPAKRRGRRVIARQEQHQRRDGQRGEREPDEQRLDTIR